MKPLRMLVLISVFSLVTVSQSKATDILFPPGSPPGSHLPDLTGSYMDVTYNSSGSLFQAIGFSTQYTDKQTNQFSVYDNASFNYTLTANITSAGMLTNGTLTISGDPDFGSGDGGNQIFQFRFDVTGGSLASAFGGNGAEGGIIFNAAFGSGDHPFTGSWTGNFDSNNTIIGVIDAFAVPEPSSLL